MLHVNSAENMNQPKYKDTNVFISPFETIGRINTIKEFHDICKRKRNKCTK